MSSYYAYIASSHIRAKHTQLESVINLQNPVHTVKGACEENV